MKKLFITVLVFVLMLSSITMFGQNNVELITEDSELSFIIKINKAIEAAENDVIVEMYLAGLIEIKTFYEPVRWDLKQNEKIDEELLKTLQE